MRRSGLAHIDAGRPITHAAAMTGTLILLILSGLVLFVWSSAREAAENARLHARQACQRQNVQLLDQTVALRHFRLRRDDEGRMRLMRTYEFAYSADGINRQVAQLAMLGRQLLWISEPERPT